MTNWQQNTAYHEAAHTVVANALGLAVARVYLGEEENTGGSEIQAAQDQNPPISSELSTLVLKKERNSADNVIDGLASHSE